MAILYIYITTIMTRKIKQDGGIVGIVDLIRTTKDANGSFSYPSLIEYLNFLEMNYRDTYYKIGTELHSAFYENISLIDVKELLETLDTVFEQKCMTFLKQIQAKPFYKRDENDMAIFNRIYDIFMKSLSNVNTFRKNVESAKTEIDNFKKENPTITNVDILNLGMRSFEQYIQGSNKSVTGGAFNTGCTDLGAGITHCPDTVAAKVVALAVTTGVFDKFVGYVGKGLYWLLSIMFSRGGSRKKRRISRKRNSKRISYKRRRVSSKRRKL
jgi:hypothetical protein